MSPRLRPCCPPPKVAGNQSGGTAAQPPALLKCAFGVFLNAAWYKSKDEFRLVALINQEETGKKGGIEKRPATALQH
jgi:hypothetical protein